MASRDPKRPNILFILSDDQGPWAMRCAGNEEIITPALDELAARGIRFDNFFCVSPVCSPARASLLSGEIPSRHGVHDWIRGGNVGPGRIDYLEGRTLITDVLARAGYRCGLVGKWHLGAADVPREGFVKWYAHQSGMSAYYDAPMVDETRLCTGKGYLTDELTDIAIDFLHDEAGRGEPFWLSLNYTAPHYPWIDSHPQEYTRLYDGCAFESIPLEPPHPWSAGGNPATDEGHNNRRDSLAGYFAATTAMDAGIGRVTAHLDGLGLRDSTLVIFMSDNGMNCGHHGIWGKGNGTRPQNMYDTSVKVPCIFSQPGRMPEGEVAEGLFSAYDVWPTLLQYIGLDSGEKPGKPGRSFSSLLEGKEQPGREAVVVFDEYGPVRMVRTTDWKYVYRFPDGPHELFDLRTDPNERRNLIDDPAAADRLSELRGTLADWFARYADAATDGARWGVTGAGQLALARPGTPPETAFASVPIAALKKASTINQGRKT
jgi:arylsulfatase A-like enzyme